MEFVLLYSVLILVVQIDQVAAYSLGSPWGTCISMFPKHRLLPQTSECPFVISTNQSDYLPGDIITVTIASTTTERYFMGIHIRARLAEGDPELLIGQFLTWPVNKTKAFNCFGGQQNMVTHSNANPAAEVTLTWQAPNVSVGNIIFVASFVENFQTFWSDKRRYVSAKINVTVPDYARVSESFAMVDWSLCGKEKGCFLYPQTCSGYDCYAAISYRTVNQTIQFEMFGSKRGFISVGFSDDKEMGDDETMTCITGDKGVRIQRGYNHASFNEKQQLAGLTNLEVQYVDGRLFCRFTRPLEMFSYINRGHTSKRYFDFTKDHYLMLGWGPVLGGSDVMSTHIELPPVTFTKVNLRENKIVRGSALPQSKRIHGTLMLVAWILFAGIATVLPRYFKNGLFGKKICGVQSWFQVHRAVAVTAWVLTGAGFTLIFIVLDGLKEEVDVHHYLGIAVMSACTLQVLFGILRPGPESKFRPVFNVGHWLLGKLTHLAAGVTFFYAFEQDIIPKPQREFGYIVLGVWLGHQLLWEMSFELYQRCQTYKREKYVMSNGTKSAVQNEQDGLKMKIDSGTSGKTTLFFVYIICLVIIEAAALASIFLF